MDPPTERMPIACVHCAKAKAKCDKKVPCSRCVSKQIVCQSRATRRSSQNPSRKNNLPRNHSERTLHTSAAFHVSQLSQFSTPAQELPMVSPSRSYSVMQYFNEGSQAADTLSPHGHHRHSLPDITHPIQIAPAMFGPELEPQMIRNGYTHTPPDLTMPITPLMPNMPNIDHFIPMSTTHYDPDADSQFLNMNGGHGSLMEFDPNNILGEFMSPPSILQDTNDQFLMQGKGMVQTPNQMSMSVNGSASLGSRVDLESPPQHVPYRSLTGLSPTSATMVGLQEPDAVLASHSAWPFFQCTRVEKYSYFPPKTASIYLEGLAQTLRNQATWNAWTAQLDERNLDVVTERRISTEPIVGWSREKLLAITQGFLHKALDIHKVSSSGRDEAPASPESNHQDAFLMLPPPEVMQYFLRSYVVRYEPYYSSVPGGRLDPNSLMHSPNSKAASLLILLMVASGATATQTVEARYVASGLTEACRISLFDTIEKDIAQSREVIILRSALLFTSLAAWSGDKWHMDIAMGQRGMYLAMLSHAGILEVSDSRIDINECKQDPERAWEDWKEHEGRHRLAHSWIIIDQEMSLFSDTTPLLSVVDLHVPMPDSDDLWHASNAIEWLALFEQTHGSTYCSPSSVRDLFTKFVEGDLAGNKLSPIQLRLLLHPLQAQVCQSRQFIACLPDGGNRAGASRTVSKAATKARLEEISALLQQWYVITKKSFCGNQGTCWTTCANLIMYHLISLTVITSFKCIEQFARKEVNLGSFRHAAWLQNRCIDQPEEAYFHCGQILRLIKSMPKPVRPPWWAGAVYRVAMTGWATSISMGGARYANDDQAGQANNQFAIDNLTPEHESITRYIKYQEGEPVLTGSDGKMIPVSVPSNILTHCIDVLEEDSSMRLADGIKRKLRAFMNNWKDN